MINHARTLLLNKSSAEYAPGDLGEEYLPPDYRAVVLPTKIDLARKIIFGADPDPDFVNFRLFELLSLIHNTELAEFIYALDSRVTYWPRQQTDFYQAQKNVIVKKTGGTLDSLLYVHGQPVADVRVGVLSGDYAVRLLTRSGVLRIVINQIDRKSVIDQQIDLPGPTLGMSDRVPLPNSNMTVQIADYTSPIGYILLESVTPPEHFLLQENAEKIQLETAPAPEILAVKNRLSVMATDTVLARWNIKTYARPESAITACLPRLELLGEPAFLELFGVGNVPEPYKTFKNIWFDAKDPSYRLAALTLALIYRTEERRDAS